jgi:hypothetical protein
VEVDVDLSELVRADRVIWVQPRKAGGRVGRIYLEHFTGNPYFPGDLLLSKWGDIAYVPVSKHRGEAVEFTLEDVSDVSEIVVTKGRHEIEFAVFTVPYRVAFTGAQYVAAAAGSHTKYARSSAGYVAGGGQSSSEALQAWLQILSGKLDPHSLPVMER